MYSIVFQGRCTKAWNLFFDLKIALSFLFFKRIVIWIRYHIYIYTHDTRIYTQINTNSVMLLRSW